MIRRLIARMAEAKGAPAKEAAPKKDVGAINRVLQRLVEMTAAKDPENEITPYNPAPGVLPKGVKASKMGHDATPYDYLNQNGFGANSNFQGYPYLATRAQLPEFRKMVGTLAEEMTREWVRITSTGEGDKSDRIEQLHAAMRKYKLREAFRKAAEHDGYFGRGQIYIDVKTPSGATASDDPAELESGLFLSGKKITKGSLSGFRVVEPMWTYPGLYNSTNPLHPNFYCPRNWYVMGQTVHTSRMLMMISRPVPDMLKAAYSFGGLSLTQLAEPYVNHWIRTRDSVSDIVHSFSVSGLRTNMEATLAGEAGAGTLLKRAQLFNQLRDNRGLMLLDKESEEFFQFNTPLSSLPELQAQAQEQMSAVSSIPLVKLLGITPSGLNASSDGEIRVFYDYIHGAQESLFREPLKRAMDIIQLSEFGDIDPDIGIEFIDLHQATQGEEAQARKSDAETDEILIRSGVISPQEARKRVAGDPDGQHNSIVVDDDDDISSEPEADDPADAESD